MKRITRYDKTQANFMDAILVRKTPGSYETGWGMLETALLNNVGLRKCGTCVGIFEKAEFPVDNHSTTGRHRRCTECDRKHKRTWRRVEREKFRIQQHRWRARKAQAEGTFTLAEWNAVLAKYGGRCLRCGTLEAITPDHVIPLFLGGTNDISNIQPLCHRCNSGKGARIADYR